jgi:cobalt-zinc-cadmium efflux system membrane fusion protein
MTTSSAIRFGAGLALALSAVSACGTNTGDEGDPATAAAAPANSDSSIALPADQRERIDVVTVETSTFHPVIQTTGTVQFDGERSTPILSPMSGPVTRILAHPGDAIRAGQALAWVSSPDFAAAIAEYRKADATARNASKVAALDSQLFVNDAIARRDMEQARADAIGAEADRDAALQLLRTLGVEERTLDSLVAGSPTSALHGVIRSPIAGTLVERSINVGQLLEAGATPAFTVADISTMWVMANVFESDLASVHKGDAASVTTTASPTVFTGTVDNIAALVDPATKATTVRIRVPNRGALLKKDMYVNVGLRSRGARSGVLVPVAAVLRDEDNRPFVYVADSSSGYRRRSVELGLRLDDRYEITSGLAPGERVVAKGGLFLQFAQNQ